MPVTELYAFNLICENLLAALYGVALSTLAVSQSIQLLSDINLYCAVFLDFFNLYNV